VQQNLRIRRLAVAVSAAPLVAWPETTCAVPSVVTVTGGGQLAIPDSASSHVKVTVTSVWFHPAAFGAGLTVAVIVGAVTSSVTP
jgi:hypothetical protein